MLAKVLLPNRWFIWALVFICATGFALIAYTQWVNLELQTYNDLLVV